MEKMIMREIKSIREGNLVHMLKEGSNGLLTRKEAVIASYLVEDYTVNDIADLLCRSRNTVKMHIKNIKRKCRCETRTRLGAVLQSFIKNNPQGYIKSDSNV